MAILNFRLFAKKVCHWETLFEESQFDFRLPTIQVVFENLLLFRKLLNNLVDAILQQNDASLTKLTLTFVCDI